MRAETGLSTNESNCGDETGPEESTKDVSTDVEEGEKSSNPGNKKPDLESLRLVQVKSPSEEESSSDEEASSSPPNP